MFRLVCLAILVTAVTGQIVSDGMCSTIEYVTDLNLTAIMGAWNQIARINDEVGECSSLTLAGQFDANPELTGILGAYVQVSNNTKTTSVGPLEVVDDGVFYINITGFFAGRILVQAIDYSNYVVLYACEISNYANENGTVKYTKNVWGWQYNRKATLSSTEQAAIQKIVDANPDLKDAEWKFVNHTKAACGDAGMPLAISNVLMIFAILFISKEFV